MRTIILSLFIALITSTFLYASGGGNGIERITTEVSDTLPLRKDSSSMLEYTDEEGNVKVFERVDVEATFPGGAKAWNQFLMDNLDASMPVMNGAPPGTYKVVVQFIVNKDGSIIDAKALTSHGYGMENEILRLIEKSPKWVPAQMSGRMVKAYRKQPVTFVVQEAGRKRRKG